MVQKCFFEPNDNVVGIFMTFVSKDWLEIKWYMPEIIIWHVYQELNGENERTLKLTVIPKINQTEKLINVPFTVTSAFDSEKIIFQQIDII